MKIETRKLKISGRAGFTLVETLVAIGLFGIVISIAVGGFVRALRTEAEIMSMVSANANASLSLEQMAREIRTGFNFTDTDCDPSSNKNCQTLSFTNANGDNVEYSLAGGIIQKKTGSGDSQPLTANNIVVQYLIFHLQGEKSGDGWPPRITISLGVTPAKNLGDISTTRLQTTISARQIDG